MAYDAFLGTFLSQCQDVMESEQKDLTTATFLESTDLKLWKTMTSVTSFCSNVKEVRYEKGTRFQNNIF